MTAITAARAGIKGILLLDSQPKVGAKILMSGGTRCNLTNENIETNDYEGEQKNIFRAVLAAFSSQKAVEFFEELGVSVVLEAGGKYFPSTHSGRTVLEALLAEVKKLGVDLENPKKVNNLIFQDEHFHVQGKGFSYSSEAVALTPGGLSYPTTGSDGAGYGLAGFFGHKIVETTPALTPLLTDDPDWKTLTGLSLPVRLTFWEHGKKKISFEGPFLFTHFGFSGPTALNISRHWIRAKEKQGLKLTASFLPGWKEDDFCHKIIEAITQSPSLQIKSVLAEALPGRFIEMLLGKLRIPGTLVLNQLRKEQREQLMKALFHFSLQVSGAVGYQKAEVTAGGIDLVEVDKATLESKLRPGLFFAGELLDVDGRIGGFNFQWAWSSGFVAGWGIAQKLLQTK